MFVTQINSLNSLCLFSLRTGFCLSTGAETGRTANASTAQPQSNKTLQGSCRAQSQVFLINIPQWYSTKNEFCERLGAAMLLGTGASVNVGVSWLRPKLLEPQFSQEEIPTDPGCHSWTWCSSGKNHYIIAPAPVQVPIPRAPIGISPDYKTSSASSADLYTNQPSGS